jgi:hypothetical protein
VTRLYARPKSRSAQNVTVTMVSKTCYNSWV